MSVHRSALVKLPPGNEWGGLLRQVAVRRGTADSPDGTSEILRPVPASRLQPTTVLVIDHDAAHAELIQKALAVAGQGPFWVEWVTCLSAGLERLARAAFDVILLDPTPPDCQGFEAFERLYAAAPDALPLVLAPVPHKESTRQALRPAAQECLPECSLYESWLRSEVRQRPQGG